MRLSSSPPRKILEPPITRVYINVLQAVMAQDLEIWARKSAKEGTNVNCKTRPEAGSFALDGEEDPT